MVVPGFRLASVIGFHHPGCARHVDPPHPVDVQNPGALGIDHKRQMHNRRRLQLAQQQKQLAGRFFSSQVERNEAIDLGMSWGRDIHAHHRAIRELRHQSLAKITRNAGDDDGWFCRIHLVGVLRALLRRRLCSPGRHRHGRILRRAEVGIVQVNIALKPLHAVADSAGWKLSSRISAFTASRGSVSLLTIL